MQLGDCFLNIATEAHQSHCWVIISNPNLNPALVAIVNLTSWNESRLDDSCLIESGEHPFVKHRTCINYREARRSSIDKIDRGIKNGILIPTDPMSAEISNRIISGTIKSRFRPEWLINLLRAQGLID